MKQRALAFVVGLSILLFSGSLTQAWAIDQTFSAAPKPVISGIAEVGETLTVDPGTWQPTPDSLSIQWLSNGQDITGATEPTFTARAEDIGSRISVRVTALKAGYVSASSVSNQLEPVVGAHFEAAPTPVISGNPVVGQQLTVDPGVWDPIPDSLTLQWSRSGVPIAGATGSAYVVSSDDVEYSLAVTVTAVKIGHEVVQRTSVATAPATLATPPQQLRLQSGTRLPIWYSITTHGWDDAPPWENPVYPQPTPAASSITLPSSINQFNEFVSGNGYTIGRPAKPNHFVLHHTAGTSWQGAVTQLRGLGGAPTANYVVQDGNLISMVPESSSPWTNGRWTSNLYSVTFEMVNQSYSSGRWISPSAATRETTAWAMARAAQRWGMELPLQYGINVFGHRDVSKSATACPGDLDVQAVVNRANEILGTPAFVKAAYADVLGRAPEPQGLNYWIARLAAGTPRAAIADGFNYSDEYFTLKINEAYRAALNRDPEPSGFAYWMNELRQRNLSPEDLHARFLHSQEMYYTRGGGTNAGYVTALYRSLLGRDPEPGGLAYWTGRLGAGEPWQAISNGIWYSTERYNYRANEAFLKFLGRPAEPAAQDYWSWVARTQGPTAMRSGIMASGEYWNRAFSRFANS